MIITIVIINQQWWYGGLCVSATNFSMPNQPCMAFEHNFFFRAFYRELIDGIVAACPCLVVGRRPLPHTSILINVCFRWCRCIFGSQRIAINKEKKVHSARKQSRGAATLKSRWLIVSTSMQSIVQPLWRGSLNISIYIYEYDNRRVVRCAWAGNRITHRSPCLQPLFAFAGLVFVCICVANKRAHGKETL